MQFTRVNVKERSHTDSKETIRMRPAVTISFLSVALLSLVATTACSGAASVGEDTDRTAEGVLADDGPGPKPTPPRIPPKPAPLPDCAPGQFPASQYVDGVCELTPAEGCTWTDPVLCYEAMDESPPSGTVVTTALALGAHTTYALGVPTDFGASDDRAAVYGWGLNADYELGNGTTTSSSYPVVALWIPGNIVTAIAAGDEDACALMHDDSVMCWGTLATLPSAVVNKTPASIAFPAGTAIGQIAHGQNHACAVTTDGIAVYCWGNNDKQQLGDAKSSAGRAAPFKVPFTLSGSTKIVALTAGGRSTCALESTGTVWCWGDNERGALGNARGVLACPNSPFPCATPVQGSATSYTATPQQVVAPTDPLSGDSLTFAAPTTGGYATLVGGGAGTFCAQTLDPLTAASDGWFCWGANDQGQAAILLDGVNLTVDLTAPIKTMPGVNQAPLIAVGLNHSCVGGPSWSMGCFGANEDGQLGTGATGTTPLFAPQSVITTQLYDSSVQTFTSFAVGGNHSCAILPQSTNGSSSNLACWGSDDSGQTGEPSDTIGSTGWVLASPLEPMYLTW
jgi:hypothetical protein